MTTNNSAKEIHSMLDNLEEFMKFLKIVAPYRYSARVILRQLTPQIESLRPQVEKLVELTKQADDFNNRFNSRAWLCYGKTSLTIVEECFSKSDDEAEELLADYFCNKVAEIINLSASPQSLLGPHAEMIHHAYKLTQEGDYLAAIPLLLIITDGISNNIFETGVFSDKNKCEVIAPNYDYAVAFDDVRYELSATKKRINTEVAKAPYRHGILHGKFTNYATKTNAGKCWNFLGATLELLEFINSQNNINSHPLIEYNEQRKSAKEYTLGELLELYDKSYEVIIKPDDASEELLDKYFSLPEISDLNALNDIVNERQIEEELDDDLVLHCVIKLFHYWQNERFNLLQRYIDRIAYLEYRVKRKNVSENQYEYIRTRYLRDILGNYKLSNFKIIGQDRELKGSLRTITVEASISTNGLNETITFNINMQDMNATTDLKIEANSTITRNWELVSSIFLTRELPKCEEYIDIADQNLEKYLDNKNIF